MSRPTRPPGPPPDDREDPQRRPAPHAPRGRPGPPAPQSPEPAAGRPQPRFTPRQDAPPQSHPYGQASQPPPAAPPQPPPASPPARPTFTPHRDGPRRDNAQQDQDKASQDRAQRGGRRGAEHAAGRGAGQRDRPRPTFTPREGYPPDGGRRGSPPPQTTILPPVPAGYPQQAYTQPFAYPEAPEREAPLRDGDGRPPDDAEHGTRVLEVPSAHRDTGPQAIITQPNLARSSQVMALGTIASRATGFLRTFVLVAALGTAGLADAYNNSNTLPNTVYYLMLGGIFTSVVVPMLVRAAKEDPDRGEGYAERIFTLGVISLLIITVAATALASPLVNLYAGNITIPGEHRLMLIFAYFFIPQIFFYGMDSLLGAILNVRGRFGPNMWTPVINNVVVILVGVLFIATVGLGKNPANISNSGIALLAIGTTAGIVIQSIALFPILRRAGFSMRLRWDLRRAEIAEIGLMAGWMFGYVASQWVGNLVAQRVANAAANSAYVNSNGTVTGVGYSAYSYAWQLFQLPYAIVGISVISALLPRMSGHATDRRYSLVRDDFSKGVRLASVIVVPAAVFLAVLGAPLCELLFAWGSTTVANARYIGEVFGVFSLGLVAFMLTQLQLRVFYSFRENRTPAIIGIVMLIVGVIGALVALYALPAAHTVIGLAVAYDLVTLTGAVVAWPLLLRRVGSLDGWRITRSLVRMFLATLPGLAFIFVVISVVGSFMQQGRVYGLVVTVIGGGGALLLYALCARVLGLEEFRTLLRSVGGRFGRAT
jgi:putative peptidoglycan lipid II flippase